MCPPIPASRSTWRVTRVCTPTASRGNSAGRNWWTSITDRRRPPAQTRQGVEHHRSADCEPHRTRSQPRRQASQRGSPIRHNSEETGPEERHVDPLEVGIECGHHITESRVVCRRKRLQPHPDGLPGELRRTGVATTSSPGERYEVSSLHPRTDTDVGDEYAIFNQSCPGQPQELSDVRGRQAVIDLGCSNPEQRTGGDGREMLEQAG